MQWCTFGYRNTLFFPELAASFALEANIIRHLVSSIARPTQPFVPLVVSEKKSLDRLFRGDTLNRILCRVVDEKDRLQVVTNLGFAQLRNDFVALLMSIRELASAYDALKAS